MCISVGALVVMGHICFDSRFVNLNTFVYKDELLTVVDILFFDFSWRVRKAVKKSTVGLEQVR